MEAGSPGEVAHEGHGVNASDGTLTPATHFRVPGLTLDCADSKPGGARGTFLIPARAPEQHGGYLFRK